MHADELEQGEREYNSRHAEQDMPYLEKPLLQPTECANSKINNYIVDNRANDVNYQNDQFKIRWNPSLKTKQRKLLH